MTEKPKSKQRFCGNCGNHNAYDYPVKVFCTRRFAKNENPVVETLWCCAEWNPSSQECYCIEEAKNRQNSR